MKRLAAVLFLAAMSLWSSVLTMGGGHAAASQNPDHASFYRTCTETADAYVEEVGATVWNEDQKYAYLRDAYVNCQCYFEYLGQGGDISGKDLKKPLRIQMLPFSNVVLPEICYIGTTAVTAVGGVRPLPLDDGSSSSSSSGSSSGGAFMSVDIGPDANSGSTSENGGTFTIAVASGSLGAQIDDFRFVYRQISGDVTITARVASISGADHWARAGVHIRDNLNSDSMNASMFITSQYRLAQYRPTNGGTTVYTYDPDSPSKWLRLQRTGSTVTASYSSDGNNFTAYQTYTINFGSNVYVGLGVTSSDPAVPATAVIDNVTITQNGTAI